MFQSVKVGSDHIQILCLGQDFFREELLQSWYVVQPQGHYIMFSEFSVKAGPWSCATQLSSTH